jgi:hypothetical protein
MVNKTKNIMKILSIIFILDNNTKIKDEIKMAEYKTKLK